MTEETKVDTSNDMEFEVTDPPVNDQHQDDDPQPPQRRRPLQRVLLQGVDEVSPSIVAAVLGRVNTTFKWPVPTFKPTPSGTGVIMSHPEANLLLSDDIPDDLFGSRTRFTVTPRSSTAPTLFVRNITTSISNDDLLVSIPGSFRIRRLKNMTSKAFVYFTDDVSRALVLRDGVTIGRTVLVFEVPKGTLCRVCHSREHQSCSDQPLCYRCGGSDHLANECINIEQCLFCGQEDDHLTRQCPEYHQWQVSKQLEESTRLLTLVPTVQETLSGAQDVTPVLSRRQQKMLQEGQSKGLTTYADVVKAKLTLSKKRKSKKRKEAKAKQDQANSQNRSQPQSKPSDKAEKPPSDDQEQPKDQPQHDLNPIDAIIDTFELSGFSPEVAQDLRLELRSDLEKTLKSWADSMTNSIQALLDRHLAQQESSEKLLSDTEVNNLQSGHWSITCECGDTFTYANRKAHQDQCRLQQDPSESVEEVSEPPSTPSKRSRSYQPDDSGRKTKPNRSTPEKIKELKQLNIQFVKTPSKPSQSSKSSQGSTGKPSNKSTKKPSSARKPRSLNRAGRR